MSENLYIKSNRYSNPVFRDEFERIFREESDTDELGCDIQTEMEKGRVLGHFV